MAHAALRGSGGGSRPLPRRSSGSAGARRAWCAVKALRASSGVAPEAPGAVWPRPGCTSSMPCSRR
eukprot:15431819-Alexandrium_andersonii.AAC.1